MIKVSTITATIETICFEFTAVQRRTYTDRFLKSALDSFKAICSLFPASDELATLAEQFFQSEPRQPLESSPGRRLDIQGK